MRPCDTSTSSLVGGHAMALDCDNDDGDDTDDDDKSDRATGDDMQREPEKYAEHVVETLRCAQCKKVLESPVLQASCGERWHQPCFKAFKYVVTQPVTCRRPLRLWVGPPSPITPRLVISFR